MSEPWQWDSDAIRATVGAIRAGRSLAPQAWPHDATAAVALSFDSDHETIPLRDGLTSPGKLSQGGTPSWDFTPATFEIITELGLAYDSSLMADDDPYEIEANGLPTGVVEIPVAVASYVAAQAGLGTC